MPPRAPPTIYENEKAPDWGLGIIVRDLEGKVTLVFEHTGEKVFVKSLLAKVLKPRALPEAEAAALDERLRGRKHKPSTGAAGKKKGLKKGSAALAKAAFPSFQVQLERFEALFPGGFSNDDYVGQERGRPGVSGKAGYKEAAIAFARAELSPDRFESSTPAELFDAAKKALQATNIVHPIEGPVPFGQIAEGDRAPLVAALKDVLHGTGNYPERFERFVRSFNLHDKAGKPKRVTWPLATLLPALYHPETQVAVKPTAFASQGAMLGIDIGRSHSVDAAGYAKFLAIAQKTRDLLVAAGHAPRDLMDVYSFIWRTHDAKPVPVEA